MNLYTLVHTVEAYTTKQLERYLEELRHLCSIDSGSYYKPGLDMMCSRLAVLMQDIGIQVNIIEHESCGNDLLGVVRGDGEGNILLVGHIDTVYPVGTAAERPLRIEGDRVYGPGVSDMKGGILSALYAVEALLAAGYRDFGELRLLWVSDEEILERHSLDLMRQAARNCQSALVLEAARENGAIVSARKGCAMYTLLAKGRNAHAGVEPEKGRNAITELAHQVMQFTSLNGWREGITINPGRISGGTSPNVVPDHAEVHFDLRFLYRDDRISTEKRWREMMQQRHIEDVELALRHHTEFCVMAHSHIPLIPGGERVESFGTGSFYTKHGMASFSE